MKSSKDTHHKTHSGSHSFSLGSLKHRLSHLPECWSYEWWSKPQAEQIQSLNEERQYLADKASKLRDELRAVEKCLAELDKVAADTQDQPLADRNQKNVLH